MLNPFDQYSQNENKLTHALACAFDQDKVLLRAFVKQFLLGSTDATSLRLKISEQSLPGCVGLSEVEAERRGVPDLWLYDEAAQWCAVIECKITARLRRDQIERHIRTAQRQGFQTVLPVTITVNSYGTNMPGGCVKVQWKDVYAWLRDHATKHKWADLASRYFEVLEANMVEKERFADGTLTTFTGFRFEEPDSFSYAEAKRVLRLALQELRCDQTLADTLNMDRSREGRTAITGRDSDAVWDFLSVGAASGSNDHTKNLHLTLGINRHAVEASITVPHRVDAHIRKRITDLGEARFFSLAAQILDGMKPILLKEEEAVPFIRIVQRRYPSQRAKPFVDCSLNADLRTAVQDGDPVKRQPEWMSAAYSAFCNKRSNLQMQFGIMFDYRRCPSIATKGALRLVSASWRACKPLFDVVHR